MKVVALFLALGVSLATAGTLDEVLERMNQLEQTLHEAHARIRALEASAASFSSPLRGFGGSVGTTGLCGCNTFNTSTVTITGDGAAASLVVGEAATGTVNGVNVAELSDTAVRTTGGQTIDGSLAVESLRIGDWSVSQDSEGNLEVTGPSGKALITTQVHANSIQPQSGSAMTLGGDLSVAGDLSAPGVEVGAKGLQVGSASASASVVVFGELTAHGAATIDSTLTTSGLLTAPSANLGSNQFSGATATIPTLQVTQSTNLVGAYGAQAACGPSGDCPSNMWAIEAASFCHCAANKVVPA